MMLQSEVGSIKVKQITRMAILTTVSLIIFIVEAQIPPVVPVPGIKIGLSNVITLIVLAFFGRREALVVLMLRIILGSIFTGTPLSFIYSLSGGLLCYITMSLLFNFFKGNTFWVLSVLGAISHNIGQIAVAVFVTATWQTALYLPVLIISAVITGTFTGLIAQAIIEKKDHISGKK